MATSGLNDLLRATSRSFYLTLRVLPGSVRQQIGLAYLLARATDTIADTEIVPIADRLAALHALRARILRTTEFNPQFASLAEKQGASAERELLVRIHEALADLDRLAAADRALVQQVLDTITSGQELDLQRFAGASQHFIRALESAADLDDYTYRVAGCVGEFWTRLCRRHAFPAVALEEKRLIENGIRFGKGLQLVNILRDLPADLRKGRCYVPSAALREVGLTPDSLLVPQNETRFRPVYNALLDQAESHLAAGWDYTNTLPRNQIRLRLACAWPILIGTATLGKLRMAPILDGGCRVKVSRAEVRGIIFRTLWCYPFPGTWEKLAMFSAPPSAGKPVA